MNLKEIFQSRNLDLNIVLFGASYLGKLAKYALEHRKLSVHSFYDSDERKQEKIFCEYLGNPSAVGKYFFVKFFYNIFLG